LDLELIKKLIKDHTLRHADMITKSM